MSHRFQTVRDPRLSLWQSAVEEVARSDVHAERRAAGAHAEAPRAHEVLPHRMVQGAAEHAHRHDRGQRVPKPHEPAAAHLDAQRAKQARLSYLHHQMAEARRSWNLWKWLMAFLEARRYSEGDLIGWASCVTTYLAYWDLGLGKPDYRDWQKEGKGNPDYSVVPWRLPREAKIGIVGDWGTGMPDAEALLVHLLANHRVDALLHLGDVYYAGTVGQAKHNVTDVVKRARDEAARIRARRGEPPLPAEIPFLGIPGNHDYYANNSGFWKIVDQVNADPRQRQQASFFCLRTENEDGWQFLGMDTGIHDHKPLKAVSNPDITDSEAEWHRDKLDRWPGRTVLLSHHQVFSVNSKVNPATTVAEQLNPDTGERRKVSTPPNVNDGLYARFKDRLGRVEAWLWGHEHNLAVYAANPWLKRGRLVGSSAFEQMGGQDPYQVNYPGFPYQEGVRFLDHHDGYFNHGYAVMDLADAAHDGQATITYFQFPSWGHPVWDMDAAAPGALEGWLQENGLLGIDVLADAPAAVPAPSAGD